jgi:citrate lyase beta subunit
MNANAFHNVANVLIALSAGVTAALLATGCTTLPTGAMDCAASWLDPTYSAAAAAALGVVKSVVNVFRDGLGGLFKVQPPVRK